MKWLYLAFAVVGCLALNLNLVFAIGGPHFVDTPYYRQIQSKDARLLKVVVPDETGIEGQAVGPSTTTFVVHEEVLRRLEFFRGRLDFFRTMQAGARQRAELGNSPSTLTEAITENSEFKINFGFNRSSFSLMLDILYTGHLGAIKNEGDREGVLHLVDYWEHMGALAPDDVPAVVSSTSPADEEEDDRAARTEAQSRRHNSTWLVMAVAESASSGAVTDLIERRSVPADLSFYTRLAIRIRDVRDKEKSSREEGQLAFFTPEQLKRLGEIEEEAIEEVKRLVYCHVETEPEAIATNAFVAEVLEVVSKSTLDARSKKEFTEIFEVRFMTGKKMCENLETHRKSLLATKARLVENKLREVMKKYGTEESAEVKFEDIPGLTVSDGAKTALIYKLCDKGGDGIVRSEADQFIGLKYVTLDDSIEHERIKILCHSANRLNTERKIADRAFALALRALRREGHKIQLAFKSARLVGEKPIFETLVPDRILIVWGTGAVGLGDMGLEFAVPKKSKDKVETRSFATQTDKFENPTVSSSILSREPSASVVGGAVIDAALQSVEPVDAAAAGTDEGHDEVPAAEGPPARAVDEYEKLPSETNKEWRARVNALKKAAEAQSAAMRGTVVMPCPESGTSTKKKRRG